MPPGRQSPYVLRVLDSLAARPAGTALRLPGRRVAAGELRDDVRSAAAVLHRAGMGPGRMLAILTEPNQPAMLVSRYAAHLLGAAVVHIRSMNPRSDAESFPLATQAGILRDTGARVLVVDEENSGRGAELAAADTALTVLGEKDLVAPGDADQPDPAPYDAEALAVVDFTSGSTAAPKMVRQPYGTRETLIDLLAGGQDPSRPTTLLSVTPISHTTAPMADAVLAGGGTLVLHEGFDTDAVLRSFAEDGVTDVYLAVPHLYRLLEHPGTVQADLSALRRVVYSGTPAAPSRIARAVEVFGDRLVQVYGATETGGITSLTPEDHREPELLGSVGRPFPWVRIALRDPESGEEVERGEVGEVCVASPTVMDGYLGDGAPAAGTPGPDAVHTGDLGRWDAYGYLRLTGRIGRVVKSGGLKLDPLAIERVLLDHPQVRDATVYGVRDADYVEHVHAAVALRHGQRCSQEELRTHVATAMSATHAPVRISLWEELPLNGSGKPDHAILRTEKGAP